MHEDRPPAAAGSEPRATAHAASPPDSTRPQARPSASHRAPATTDHRHPSRGIPPVEWLSAFTSASKEIFGANWEPRLAEFLAFLRRRLTGEFTVDDYGFDQEVTEQFLMAAMRPIAQKWFRVEVRGAENIPTEGGALMVSNHSGTVPIDGMVTAFSIREKTGRFLRPLGADLVFKLPIVSDLARKGGATLACLDDAERMLRGGELVGVWPEGFKGGVVPLNTAVAIPTGSPTPVERRPVGNISQSATGNTPEKIDTGSHSSSCPMVIPTKSPVDISR